LWEPSQAPPTVILASVSDLSATYFDGWYADMSASPAKDALVRRHLGLPPELLSTSLLGWEGIADVVAALRLVPGQTLLDLACGRGGYGLEVTARTGARLVGVDFSAEAVRQATGNARRLGRDARFAVGSLEATGLADASVDAVLVVDAIQFADPPAAGYQEIARVLRPGGRAVLTCWEGRDPGDVRLPLRLRRTDLAAGLAGAGFTEVTVTEQPRWLEAEQRLWEEAASIDPGDDPALRSLHDEGVASLARQPLIRRVLGVAARA
jgi:SAM-dependent methyltransferase